MKKLVLTLALVFGVLAANAQYFGVKPKSRCMDF